MASEAETAGVAKQSSENEPALNPSVSVPTQSEKTPVSKGPEKSPKTDYIEPLQRRLGPHESAINAPTASSLIAGPVEFELRKIVGLVVASGKHKPGFSGEFLNEVTELTAQFMSHFVDNLHKLTEVQRHHIPGICDLEMCLEAQNVSCTQLYKEYLRTKALDPAARRQARQISDELNKLLREYNAGNYTLDKNDPLLVFHANEQHEIAALVPRQVLRRDYIPLYLPELPPDFTFTLTGNYMQTTTDLKEIKLKLAEESRMNEASLYNLIDDDERRWRQHLERDLAALDSLDLETVMSEIMSPSQDEGFPEMEAEEEPDQVKGDSEKPVEGSENREKSEQATVPGKAFDFVEYARKRQRARERYALEMERRRKLRRENIFMKAETVFSPYAKRPPTKADISHYEEVLETAFKRVIKATRSAEEKKKQRLARLLEERRKREEEQEEKNGAFEFGFNFNPTSNILDDSDDEPHMETLKEYDFGDSSEKNEGTGMEDVILEDVEMQDAGVALSEVEPKKDQVSGKAPFKEDAKDKDEPLDQLESMSDDQADLEDELEQHFGGEEAGTESGEIPTQNEGVAVHETHLHIDGNGSLGGAEEPGVPDPEARVPPAHVLWGDGGSDESDDDDLEDLDDLV